LEVIFNRSLSEVNAVEERIKSSRQKCEGMEREFYNEVGRLEKMIGRELDNKE
jgi:polyphosphate kinase 2 (PPK2 family)